MLIKNIIIISIIFSVSSADEHDNNISDGNFEYVINAGSSCSDKISATLRNEIDKLNDVNKKILENLEMIKLKMDGSETKITNKLDEIIIKFDIFEDNYESNQMYHDFEEKNEESVNNKLDKIQTNIGEKLASLEQHINQKLHAFEKIIADKTGITIINNNKLSASEKNQLDLEENNIISKSIQKSTANETLEQIKNDITQKFSVIETKISELENTTSYFRFEELDKNLMKLEENFNRKWTDLKNMIPEMQENIKHRLDALNNEIPEQLEQREIFKLNEMEKIIPVLKAESLVKEDIVSERTQDYWDCKELQARGYDYKPIRMDNETFKHITLESDEDGLIYFEMHLAIKSEGLTVIQLSSEANPRKEDGYFAIGIADGHARSWIYNVKPRDDDNDIIYLYDLLQSASTPADIITTTEFKAFYVRIINQTLEFGSEGTDSPPILKYRDERFRTLKYIGFTSWGDYYTGSFLYDCPPTFEGEFRLDALNQEIPEQFEDREIFELDEVEEIPMKMYAESLVKEEILTERTLGYWDCKELQAHGYDFKPIRIDNETFDHVTLESDEDGLIHFEMHLAIKSAGLTVIQLSSDANPTEEDGYFAIGIADGHARSWIYNFKLGSDYNDIVKLYRQIQLQSASTPADILTTTEFKAFYVRIINETLEFGSEGTDSAPILRYKDERFRTLKYIGFTSWGDYYTGSFLYDCPPKFEESL